MASSSVTIRVDSDVKEAASRIAEHFGFDLSSVTLNSRIILRPHPSPR